MVESRIAWALVAEFIEVQLESGRVYARHQRRNYL